MNRSRWAHDRGRIAHDRVSAAPSLAAAALVVLVASLTAGPAWAVASALTDWAAPTAPHLGADIASTPAALTPAVLARTAWVVLLLAGLTVSLAYPAGWWLRGQLGRGPGGAGAAGAGRTARAQSRASLVALMLCPLLLPGYLWYAALSMARGPGTWLGDALARGPEWLNLASARLAAGAGVACWLWPLAAGVLGTWLLRVPQGALDALALTPGPWWRRAAVRARLARGGVVMALAVTGLVLLGSAVPLHLARIDTAAMSLWRLLDLSPQPGGAYAAAWPLGLAALIAGAWTARLVARDAPSEETGEPVAPPARWLTRTAWGLWSVTALTPAALLATAPLRAEHFERFSNDGLRAASASAGVGLAVGGVLLTLAGLTWLALSGPRGSGRVVRVVVALTGGVLTLWAVLPGVLVGSAVARAGSLAGAAWPGAAGVIDDSPLPLVVAHALRFGVLGVLAGWALARSEAPSLRDTRAQLGAHGLWAWWVTGPRGPGGAALVGIAVAGLALSLHEIEAAVIVQPPGRASLARLLLEHLHYLRDADLAAAVLSLWPATALAAWASAWLLIRSRGRGT